MLFPRVLFRGQEQATLGVMQIIRPHRYFVIDLVLTSSGDPIKSRDPADRIQGSTYLKSCPSNFRVLVKTTVLAGMLRPIEKVSVANKTLMRPS